MNTLKYIIILVLILFSNTVYSQSEINEFSMDLYDESRERLIPIIVYSPLETNENTQIIIMNHGYGQNNPGSYKTYSKITRKLASEGYFVISIQHELPTDDPLAMEGNFLETRMPNWQKGVDNILYAVKDFKKIKSNLDWDNVALIGHSNGGDMAILFATKHPSLIKKAISLDHRRMPIPLTKKPKLYTLRGCDYEADEGVLPSKEDCNKYNIRIVQLKDIRHGDMDDKGNHYQLEVINRYLHDFLND